MDESIALMGFKACGKSTVGKALAKRLGWPFLDLDRAIETAHSAEYHEYLTFREIFQKYGAPYFRQLEQSTLSQVTKNGRQVIALGGGTLTEAKGEQYLTNTFLIYLEVRAEVLWERILLGRIPPFLRSDNPKLTFEQLLLQRSAVFRKLAQLTVDNSNRDPCQVVDEIIEKMP